MRNGATNTILLVVVIAILAIAGLFMLSKQNTTVAPEKEAPTVTPSQAVSNGGGNGIIEGDERGPAFRGVDVTIENFAFNSPSLTVKKGSTVTWKNDDSVAHTVTSDTGAFDSALLSQDKTFMFTFNEAGTFAYHCEPHPNMKGTIIVE